MSEADNTGSLGGDDEVDERARRQLRALDFREECLNCAVAMALARVVIQGKNIVGDVDLADAATGEAPLPDELEIDHEKAQDLTTGLYFLGAKMVREGLHQLNLMRHCGGPVDSSKIDTTGTAVPMVLCGSTGAPYDGLPKEQEK
jgi:hypothetical protein